MRTLIAIRSYQGDPTAFAAYDRYQTVTTADVTFASDERGAPMQAGGRNSVGYDLARLFRMGLYPHPHCGWRCGDYCYYVLREDLPDYDHYWLIEPDILINTPDLNAFFAQFDGDNADYLVAGYGPRTSWWAWHATIKDDYPYVYGGLFPITRVSARAIDYLYAARRQFSAQSQGRKPELWPNDESFVASALTAGGFRCADLNAPDRIVHNRFTLRTAVAQDRSRLAILPPDGLVYHPVRDIARIAGEAELRIQKIATQGAHLGETRLPVWLSHVAETLLESAHYKSAALVPLTLAVPPAGKAGQPPWRASNDIASVMPALPGVEHRRTGAMAAAARRRIEHFGVPADAKPFATVHQAAARTEIAGPGAVAADDFTIAPGFGIATFPHGFALPYAIDFSKRKLLCTAHIAPHKLLGERALSDTQRALARVVIRVPWASLRQLAPTLKPRIAPVFIFAANTADACSDIPCSGATRFITEPGIIAQFSGAAGRHANVNAETLRLLLRAVVGLFCQVHVPEDAAGPCVFRLRDAEPELLAAFPEATVMRVAAPQGSKAVLF